MLLFGNTASFSHSVLVPTLNILFFFTTSAKWQTLFNLSLFRVHREKTSVGNTVSFSHPVPLYFLIKKMEKKKVFLRRHVPINLPICTKTFFFWEMEKSNFFSCPGIRLLCHVVDLIKQKKRSFFRNCRKRRKEIKAINFRIGLRGKKKRRIARRDFCSFFHLFPPPPFLLCFFMVIGTV